MGIEEFGEPERAVYEVTEYYCPRTPLGQCNQRLPGESRKGGKTIEIVLARFSSLNEHNAAFQQAKLGAPICSIHGEEMIPLLFKLDRPTSPPDVHSN
jgi:hypothetical protein